MLQTPFAVEKKRKNVPIENPEQKEDREEGMPCGKETATEAQQLGLVINPDLFRLQSHVCKP